MMIRRLEVILMVLIAAITISSCGGETGAPCRSADDCGPCQKCQNGSCVLDESLLNPCGRCEKTPEEICGDGRDNDCDGAADEGCADSCEGVSCDQPPANDCLGSGTLRAYQRSGRCVDGVCQYDFEDIACPDGCTGGACQGDLCPALDCDDSNICTNDSCDPGSGCQHAYNQDPCDDRDACTKDDRCGAGRCVAGPPFSCDDGNACTDDRCEPAAGCRHELNSSACDDGDVCTMADRCREGNCYGSPLDGDRDGYLPERCGGNDCDDGRASVNAGVFEGPSGSAACADGVDNDCDGSTDLDDQACRECSDDPSCDDGDPCNGAERCLDHSCRPGVALACDDGNPCTDDSCSRNGGCQHANNATPCDDGSVCTVGDRCGGGSCGGGAPRDCSDGNACTTDTCHPQSGCGHVNNTAGCDDRNPCTMEDVCAGGACRGVALDGDHDGYVAKSCGGPDCNDGNPSVSPGAIEGPYGNASCSDTIDNDCDATIDMNDTGCHACENDPDCSDNNVCNGTERCVDSSCQSGTPLSCYDDNICTTDSCGPTSGCQYTNNTRSCDDGSFCTTGDRCQDGACAGTTITCNDNNPCTDDTCSAASGCLFTNNANPCDDRDPCTHDDVCGGGRCTGTSYSCDDGDVCTDNACDGRGGCTYPFNTAPCDDSQPCTKNDVCTDGSCAGVPYSCDDSNSCTADTCNGLGGCSHPALKNGTPCDDGDSCTTNDVCMSARCIGGAPPQEICNLIDDDCDGQTDEGVLAVLTQVSLNGVEDGGQKPAIAGNDPFALVWEEGPTGWVERHVFGRMVTGDGSLLTPATQIGATFANTVRSLAWNGTDYAVALTQSDCSPSLLVRFDNLVEVLGSTALGALAGCSPSFAAWGESEWAVAVHGGLGRVSTSGALLEEVGPAGFADVSRIVWTGADYGRLYVYKSQNPSASWVEFDKLNASGSSTLTPVILDGTPCCGGLTEPALVWTGSEFIAVWVKGNDDDLWLAHLSWEGAVLSKTRIAFGTFPSQILSLTWNQDRQELGILYRDSSFQFGRLTPSGELFDSYPVDGDGTVITSGPNYAIAVVSGAPQTGLVEFVQYGCQP